MGGFKNIRDVLQVADMAPKITGYTHLDPRILESCPNG
jgi:hypothetical protein